MGLASKLNTAGAAPQPSGGQQPPQGGGYPGAPPPQQQQQWAPQQGGGYPPVQHQPQFPTINQGPQGAFGQPPPPYGQQQQYGAPPPYGQQQQYGGPPPQQWGGAPQQGYGGGGLAPGAQDFAPLLQTKLNAIITANKLQPFYPPHALQGVLQRLAGVDFRALAAKWRMPTELAVDLASLSLYDIIIYADDSTSMKYADKGERIDDLKLILERVTEVATLFDTDGINIRAMNHPSVGDNIRTSAAAAQYVAGLKFSGMTPLGTKMDEKILQPFFYQRLQMRAMQKPLLVITITDGEPTQEPEDRIYSVIRRAKEVAQQSQYGPGAVAFEFAQVGKDQEAQKFLGRLDCDPIVGHHVDATSYYELEADEYAKKGVVLTPELWLVKLMVGAIDPTFDEQDE
jgi:hypothetical protein